MKKYIQFISIFIIIFIVAFSNFDSFAKTQAEPSLKSISFKNATIEGNFSPNKYDYEIVLEDQKLMPTLDTYEINGKADLFILDKTDKAGNQIGIIAKLKYDNTYKSYTFDFKNGKEYLTSTNCYLESISCNLCAVSPKLNHKDTKYTLYIPSDLNTIRLNVKTEDSNAQTDTPESIKVSKKQEIEFNINVTSTSSLTRCYTIKIKRLKYTSKELEDIMKDKKMTSVLEVKKAHDKTISLYLIGFFVAIAIIIIILIKTFKKRSYVIDYNGVEFFNFD